MVQPKDTALNVDLTRIDNAEVRRALRSILQQTHEIIAQQQVEIEALLQMVLDKHIGSMGEYKVNVQRIRQHNSQRAERVHTQLARALRDAEKVLEVAEDAPDSPEEPRRVYRL